MTENGAFLELGREAVEAGLAFAREHDLLMTIVVMDITGTVCAAARMDGSRPATYAIAVAKANAARLFETSTAVLAGRVKPENKIAIGQLGLDLAMLGGGLPLVRDGIVIGALAASGATEEQDIECADVAAAATGLPTTT